MRAMGTMRSTIGCILPPPWLSDYLLSHLIVGVLHRNLRLGRWRWRYTLRAVVADARFLAGAPVDVLPALGTAHARPSGVLEVALDGGHYLSVLLTFPVAGSCPYSLWPWGITTGPTVFATL